MGDKGGFSSLFTITSHYAHRSNALETILGRNPLNPTSYPLKTPQNRSRAFYGHELLCTRLTGGGFQPEFRPDNSKPAPNQTENGERGRNLLRGREALPAQPEKRFSARSGIGFVDGRQSRYASRRTTHHTIHRRLFTRVVPRVTTTKKQPNGESGLESGRY